MASYEVRNWQGEVCGTAELDLKVAREENAAHVVHRALVMQRTNARQGNACTKTRSEVRGGGRKPWRQKGTGRARIGSSRSPLKPGGGIIFGPKPRSFNVKINRKERRLAIRTALMSRQQETAIVEPFETALERPKTREIVAALGRWGVSPSEKTLMILDEISETLQLSTRNIANLKVIQASYLNVYDILAADRIVISSTALKAVEEVYGNDARK
ncbi:MAG: 50S ribosomal protein L4 [Cyanobacteria bacterium J06641_5]